MSGRGGDPDVLVVGAGPVGLCTAIELARRGVAVRIVDRRTVAKPGTRACTVWQRTLEVFDLMGLPVREYLSAGVPYTHRAHHFAGLPAHVRAAEQPGTPFPRPLLIGQQDTEAMLVRFLEALGVHVERGLTAVGVRQGPADAVVRLAAADGSSQLVRAGWVVAAQGPHSSLRDALGVGWHKQHCPGTQLLQVDAHFRGSLPGDPDHCHLFLTPAGSLGTAPLPDGRHRFYAGVPDPDPTVRADPSVDEVLEAARAVSGVTDLTFSRPRFNWRVRLYQSVAETYRAGRCLFAGDSAHTVMPVTAQGMNTGVQDAFNLGWKLASVVRGDASEALLDTYETERRPVALALAARNMRTYWGGVGPAPDFARLRAGLQRSGNGHTGLTLSHAGSPLSRQTHAASAAAADSGPVPQAGDRVPNLPMSTPGRAGAPRDGLLGGTGWTLLAFPEQADDPDAAARIAAQAATGSRRVGAPVRVVGRPGAVGGSGVADPDDALRDRFGARRGALLLIRPDGYLAFRGGAHEGNELRRYLAQSLR